MTRKKLETIKEIFANNPEHILLKDWNSDEKYMNLTLGSNFELEWKCYKCKTIWTASVRKRFVLEYRCPRCVLTIKPGKASLADEFPYLIPEWSKDNIYTPYELSPKSAKKIKWECQKKLGHKPWITYIYRRTYDNTICPACAVRKNNNTISGVNDLKSMRPEIAELWDYNKNIFLPEDVPGYSKLNVYWNDDEEKSRICDKTNIYSGKNGKIYDYTKNSVFKILNDKNNLKVLKYIKPIVIKNLPREKTVLYNFPHLMKYWHDDSPLDMNNISAGSKKRGKFICEQGHEWDEQVVHFINRFSKREDSCL